MATLDGDSELAALQEEPPAPVPVSQPADTSVADTIDAPAPDHETTARRLLVIAVDPNRSAEVRLAALAHATDLAAGRETELLLPLLEDRRLTTAQCELLLESAAERPAEWQAQLYLATLRTRNEPALRTQIRERLTEMTQGADRGDRAEAWVEPLVQALSQKEPEVPVFRSP